MTDARLIWVVLLYPTGIGETKGNVLTTRWPSRSVNSHFLCSWQRQGSPAYIHIIYHAHSQISIMSLQQSFKLLLPARNWTAYEIYIYELDVAVIESSRVFQASFALFLRLKTN